jgi:iron complex transport system substrate-binding protein
MMKISLLLISALLVTGCINHKSGKHRKNNELTFSDSPKSSVKIAYASGFSIEKSGTETIIVVYNPWKQNDTLATYYLTQNKPVSNSCRENDFVIQVPVKDIVTLSSTFLGMFSMLGETSRITAATNASLICDADLYRRYLHGELTDLGEEVRLNAEAVIGKSPGLVMKYIYGSADEMDHVITEAGISIAYNLEFMESHPLGRAEWIKFVAAFVGKENLADSIFHYIEIDYLRLSKNAGEEKKKPTVLDGSSYKGTWYAAGGKSYPAKLYDDAGADYFWKSDTSYGSIPLSFEIILEKQADADYWFGPSTGSRSGLLQIESRYVLLKAFQQGNVYYFGKRRNPNGGYDYYESGVVRPDLLLKDLVWVFHPNLIEKNYEPVYLEKIK